MTQSNLHKKLHRINNLVVPKKNNNNPYSAIPSRYLRMVDFLGGNLIETSAGSFCLVERTYPYSYAHGKISLQELQHSSEFPLSAFTTEDEPVNISIADMLFLDTETTGLGGTGTVAFLIGAGFFDTIGFTIHQYIIPDFSDEAGMLEHLLDKFTDKTVIVTYNGSAFDIPIIRDRMIVNRVARSIPYSRHIDLLHPTRRLFRRRLRDCSLTNIERELFHFYREDDLPGYLVPSVYFDWLAEETLESIEKVMEHNRLDIVSLCFLTALLADIYITDGMILSHVDDLHSLSKIHHRRKDFHRVLTLNRHIEHLIPSQSADDIILFHAQTFKRAGEVEKAVPLWQNLAGSSSREGYIACIELAKYYEHNVRDIPKAYQFALQAESLTNLTSRQKAMVHKRISRLAAKQRLNS